MIYISRHSRAIRIMQRNSQEEKSFISASSQLRLLLEISACEGFRVFIRGVYGSGRT
jgi:hypothetical protein